jgi:hypothetical protein
MLHASPTDENVVYAIFNNHRSGDFKPYVYKSLDQGKSWTSISGDLPERGSAYAIRQDHVDPNLLFVGTEFGCYFSKDGGKKWLKLGGLPTIAIYDLDIQKRENDLVAASFGRGFYVLDNYSPLREMTDENLNKKAHLFPVKEALLYVPSAPLGLTGTGSQGADLYAAENPAFGAVFTLYLKDEYKTLAEIRKEKEKELEKDNKDVFYPSITEIREEKNDEKATLVWIIRNADGQEIKRIKTSPIKGTSRTVWNLRKESTSPITLNKRKPGRYEDPDDGFLVTAGDYTVEVHLIKNGVSEQLIHETLFKVKALNNQTLIAENPEELDAFRSEVAEYSRKISGTGRLIQETNEKLRLIEEAIISYPNADLNLLKEARAINLQINDCEKALWGDRVLSSLEIETLPSIASRLGITEYSLVANTTGVTQTQQNNLQLVAEQYAAMRIKLDDSIKRLKVLTDKLDLVPIPYTKGANEEWKED